MLEMPEELHCTVSVGPKGVVTIPRALREKLGIIKGDTVELGVRKA